MSNFHVCDRLATVLWRDCRRQARRSYTQKLPRQLLHGSRFHSSFQP